MGFKNCTRCGESKPLSDFSAKRRVCKLCRCAQTKAWIKANPEKFAAGAARRAAVARQWAIDNPERTKEAYRRYAARSPEKCRAAGKRWRKANLDVMAALESKRRATVRGATPAWADLAAIRVVYAKARQYGMCVDHVVPLRGKTVCGLHVHANLQLLERHENQKKMNVVWPDMP